MVVDTSKCSTQVLAKAELFVSKILIRIVLDDKYSTL